MRRPTFFFLFVLIGLAIDLGSKWLVFHQLRDGGDYELAPGIIHITTAKNEGVAFSMLKEHPSLILLISAGAIAAIVWLYTKSWRAGRLPLIVSLGLLLIGATGNLADRLYFHYVRDFIDFVPEIPLIGHWAVFNVADICITVGVFLFLFSELFLQTSAPDTPLAADISQAQNSSRSS
jgi:signal peptidase II